MNWCNIVAICEVEFVQGVQALDFLQLGMLGKIVLNESFQSIWKCNCLCTFVPYCGDGLSFVHKMFKERHASRFQV